ncbi:MAG: acetaldehyde dehydrogenase (acetylating) [Ignavibacteria bacterium]|jgi:acetaldehyde dehydrogenase (acetylating)|nr:acetaldehyde dehydrogenase (acetylating) [Ignavibacteria bacterium]MCU7503660.1 acetaldehyde dehydrogenase (acetylating) [Ignavibacteria bacterium]MCU7517857.1 acetaldehyde dehydrogenase (acetylating) [Ignavibacteria bacterium]
MNLDKDLQSIQEARDLAKKAKEAQLEFKHYNQEQVDKIIRAMADAGYSEAERLAKMACEESGFGKWTDKKIKNEFATKSVYEYIKDLKTVGVIATEQNGKLVKIAEPMGVVAALVPSTNPTSTAMFKSIISLKCRNGIVCSPHPRTVNCSMEALRVISDAAEKAGAPKGLMQCMSVPTVEGTEALMRDKNVAVILATGSTPMVKAAYSAGKPAYGVGPGNVPAFIERTANYRKAVADIVYGTTFDNGTLCSSEQAMVVDRPIYQKVIEEAKAQGCYFVAGEEKAMLSRAIAKEGRINPDIVGMPAPWIAKYAGFSVPETTRVLVAEITKVGRDEPLSMEKLSPILAFYTVEGWLEGCHKCIEILNFGGIGHSMCIHSNDNDIIMKFALEKPAFRIMVNTVNSLGAVGYTTALAPSLTLGPGTWGGSIVSENVTAKHLMNVKTLAFEVNPVNSGESVSSYGSNAAGSSSFMQQIEDRLRARAGNPGLSFSAETKKPERESAEKKSGGIYGSGMNKEDLDKIIREFKK